MIRSDIRPEREALRDRLTSIRTREELDAELSRYNLSDAEHLVATLRFGYRKSRKAIAQETGCSKPAVTKFLNSVYERMA